MLSQSKKWHGPLRMVALGLVERSEALADLAQAAFDVDANAQTRQDRIDVHAFDVQSHNTVVAQPGQRGKLLEQHPA